MENQEVATVEAGLPQLSFNQEQIELIKQTVAKETTNDELALFLYACKRTGLDPLVKQIYAIKRNTKNGPVMSIQTGIDGFRLIAERTGNYVPGKEPVFADSNGKLISATAFIKKWSKASLTWHEIAATAYYEEYKNDSNPLWSKMPHAMLAKCAEALALRRAFPAELSGVYTTEEMSQAEIPVNAIETHEEAPVETNGNVKELPLAQSVPSGRVYSTISEKQAKRMYAIAMQHGWNENGFMDALADMGFKSTKDVTPKRYEEICKFFENAPVGV